MINPARFFIFSFLFFIFSIAPVKAQEPSPSTDHHLYTQQVVLDLTSALSCQLVGIDPSGQKCLTYDLNGKLSFVGLAPNEAPPGRGEVGGAIGLMSGLISTLYTPPASTGDYFRYLADNLGIIKPAYAQAGTGFAGLTPLLTIWTIFRNLAYAMFVLAFVIVGFAIMLRVRIDPRTVMTIQNQIPKLIIALLLVTFSFAIAGFLIDIMYVAMHLFFNLAKDIPGIDVGGLNPTTLQGKSALDSANALSERGGIFGLAGTTTRALVEIIMNLIGLGGPFAGFFNDSVLNLIIHTISGVVGAYMTVQGLQIPPITVFGTTLPTNIPAGFGTGAAGVALTETTLRVLIPNVIAFLIVFLAILWALFRLTFELIKAYVWILLDVTFAPIWIMTGVLPGVNFNFSSWLRDILANLSAFPTTLGMFLLGKIFIDLYSKQAGFIPPLVGNPQIPGLLVSLIGIGILLLTPQVVVMVKDAFKAPQFKYAAAIGQAIGVGGGVTTSPFTTIKNIGTSAITYSWAQKLPVPGFLGGGRK